MKRKAEIAYKEHPFIFKDSEEIFKKNSQLEDPKLKNKSNLLFRKSKTKNSSIFKKGLTKSSIKKLTVSQ